MKNVELYFNEEKDLSNRPKRKYCYLINGNFITNAYSFIKLYKNSKLIDKIKDSYGICTNKSVEDTIINKYDELMHKGFIKPIDIDFLEVKDKHYIEINGVRFNKYKINHIGSIIGKYKVYYSEQDSNFINLVGTRGEAYLLACVKF